MRLPFPNVRRALIWYFDYIGSQKRSLLGRIVERSEISREVIRWRKAYWGQEAIDHGAVDPYLILMRCRVNRLLEPIELYSWIGCIINHAESKMNSTEIKFINYMRDGFIQADAAEKTGISNRTAFRILKRLISLTNDEFKRRGITRE